MTTHKPLPVSGYREQPADNVALVNRNKEMEERTLRLLDDLASLGHTGVVPGTGNPQVDWRWLSIGRTHIEQGWMAVNRAIFQPERVAFPEDILREDHDENRSPPVAG